MTYNPMATAGEWLSVADGVWAQLQLELDPLCHRLGAVLGREMITQAMICGRQLAAEMQRQYRQTYPAALAYHLGLTLRDADRAFRAGGYVVFSEYLSSSRRILLYPHLFQELSDSICAQGLQPEMGGAEELRNTAIAHEIFHHLEELQPSLYTRSFRITLFRAGPFANTSTVGAASEIAAYQFAKQLCGLSFHPMVYNLLAIGLYRPDEVGGLIGILRGLAAKAADEAVRLPSGK